MKYKSVIIILVLLALSLSTAYAGSSRRIGTAGAQELRIPIGARGTAMGNAIMANVTGVEAIFYNPAGLANMQGTEVMFSHEPYIADVKVNFAGVATNIANLGTVAASAKITSIGDMVETTENFPDGTGRVFSPSLSVLSVSYARSLTYNVAFGATAKIVNERIFEVSATGVCFDIGFVYNPNWHGVSLGMAIRNYGPQMKFDGIGFSRDLNGRPARPVNASFDIPSSFDLGMAYNFLNVDRNSASVVGTFSNNNYSQDAWQGGVEYVYDAKYSLRAGYNYSNQSNYLYGFSAGAGVAVNLGGTDITFEYSWNQTDVFNNTQFFTGKLHF